VIARPRLLAAFLLTATLAACGSDEPSSTAATENTRLPADTTTVVSSTTAPSPTTATTEPPVESTIESTIQSTIAPDVESTAEPTKGSNDSPASTTAPADPQASVTVISTGDPATAVLLRAAPAVGETWIGTQTVDSQLSFEGLGSGPAPTAPVIAIRQTAVAESIDADGNVTVISTIDDATIVDPGDFAASELAAYEDAIAGMIGTRTTSTSDPSGQIVESEVVAPAGANPIVAETTESTVSSLSSAQFPQPVEPLGLGAEWTMTTQIENQGFVYDIEYWFVLTAIEGDVVTIDVSYVQTPRPTMIMQGVEVEATGEITGRGTTRQRIGGLLPIESSMEAGGTISLTAEGDQLDMVMYMRMSLLEDPAG
jgi:hypothetical protein